MRRRLDGYPHSCWVEIAESICLDAISQDPQQQVLWRMRWRAPPEQRAPACPQCLQVETAQMRDLEF
jgi:hypothetical protein